MFVVFVKTTVHDCVLPEMKTRGMVDPATAMRTVSNGVSQLLRAIRTRLCRIVNACRKGDIDRLSASCRTAGSGFTDSEVELSCVTFSSSSGCSHLLIRSKKISSIDVERTSYEAMLKLSVLVSSN